MTTKITVRIEGHYEIHEAPFSRSYEWHPASVTLVCGCGEKSTLTGQSTRVRCRCGADHSDIVRDIREREARLRDEATRPWRYEADEQAEQHLRDEANHPEGSPWRFNDVTSRSEDDDRNVR